MECPPVKRCKENEGHEMAKQLMQIFPEASPDFLRSVCSGQVIQNYQNIEDVISFLLENEYPKREKIVTQPIKLNLEEQLELVKQILPDADPDYLFRKCDELIDKEDELKNFIDQAIVLHNYPTKADYLRQKKISSQQRQYTSDFKVENFLQVIPNPTEYFSNRVEQKVDDYVTSHYKFCFLRNVFCKVTIACIKDKLSLHRNLLKTYEILKAGGPTIKFLKTTRKPMPMPQPVQDIPLLQEIAYIEHYNEIIEFMKMKEEKSKQTRLAAKESGLLLSCDCCYDNEIMPNDIFECTSKCQFCRSCILQYVQITFSSGKCEFKCLNDCSSNFSLRVLQEIIPQKLFAQILYQNQISEIKSANIEDLEMCPFCQFAAIPASEDKIFRCLNPDCMKETCRLCKEPSHIPLRCEEVEKDEDVQVRTYIENKMTEALVRTCWKCNAKFVKSEGCNKMTCSCGAIMCYLCRAPVNDYTHFNGPGGSSFHLCPLFNDINEVHKSNVIQGAQIAKKDIASSAVSGQLRNDPTTDIDIHYRPIHKRKSQ